MDMIKYPKINSVFKRDDNGKFTEEFSDPIFEYLFDNNWIGTEKIDGTNIRIGVSKDEQGKTEIDIRGRTDKAQLHPDLYVYLENIAKQILDSNCLNIPYNAIFFGEGYGRNIQKPGKLYSPDEYRFALFDIWINGTWMTQQTINDIATSIGLQTVPVLSETSLKDTVRIVKEGFPSWISDKPQEAEGLVLRPSVELRDARKRLILTKLKTKDWGKK